jgi:hypothetical protein
VDFKRAPMAAIMPRLPGPRTQKPIGPPGIAI